MVDFVGLLKRTIDAQSNADAGLRQRIYDRTRETVAKQMAGKNLPADIIALQQRILEKAVDEVENFYLDKAEEDLLAADDPAGIFAALQKNAGINPAAAAKPAYAARQSAPAGGFASVGPYGAYSANAGEAEQEAAADSFPFIAGRQKRAQDSGYFAHLPSPAASGGAYGGSAGGFDAPAPQSLAANPPSDRPGGKFFSFDDAEESGGAYDENGEYPQAGRAYAAAEKADFGHSAYGDAEKAGAFARRALDAPVLPDFTETFTMPAGGRAEGEFRAAPDYYRAGDQDYPQQSQAQPYAPLSTGFNAYGEPESAAEPQAADYGETADYNAAPSAGGDKDFSSLRDFLFGDAEAPAADNAAAAAPADFAAADSAALPDLAAGSAPPPNSFEAPPRGPAAGAEIGAFSPLPDFLRNPHNDGENANDSESMDAGGFDFARTLDSAEAEDTSDEAYKAENSLSAAAIADDLPDIFPGIGIEDNLAADVLLPEMQSGKTAGAGIASGIFAQAAIQEKRRSGKRRFLAGAAVIAVLLAVCGGVFWFLTDFLKNDKHKIAALVNKAAVAEAPKPEAMEKANQRLMPDGQEVDIKPQPQEHKQGAAQSAMSGAPQAVEATAGGDAVFKEAQTALMPAANAQGAVQWSLLHEKTPEGFADTVLRGEISFPGKDMFARLTLRPNHDSSIPALYLAEIMFILPENAEGVAVDKISPLMFKATEQSAGQELQDMRIYKISDNFFVETLNSREPGANPKLQRNIALMQQLPWLTMNIAYKNGRIGELSFAKGDKGDALFKQFFDARPAAQSTLPAAKADAGGKTPA